MKHLVFLIVILLVSQLSSAVPQKVQNQYWQPLVELAGEGNRQQAVDRLKDIIAAQQRAFDRNIWDGQTNAFLSTLLSSLESFDLPALYQRLPDKQDALHSVTFQRLYSDNTYKGGIVPYNSAAADSPLQSLGDFRAHIELRPQDTYLGEGYLLQSRISGIIGASSWPAVIQANKYQMAIFQAEQYQSIDLNSRWLSPYSLAFGSRLSLFDDQDLKVLLPSHAVFPNTQKVFNQVAHIGDILAKKEQQHAPVRYQKIAVTLEVNHKSMQLFYPQLADYFLELQSVLNATITLKDQLGTFLTVKLDSQDMTVAIEAYVQDSCLLPVKNNQVQAHHPVCFGENKSFWVETDIASNLLGVNVSLSGLQTNVSYRNRGEGALVTTSSNHVPDVRVAGAALGILPISFVNTLLPTSIDERVKRFIAVVMKGNDGDGLRTTTAIQSLPKASLVHVTTNVEMEIKNSLLMTLGAAAINDRVIPSTEAMTDIKRLIAEFQAALLADMERYEQSFELPI